MTFISSIFGRFILIISIVFLLHGLDSFLDYWTEVFSNSVFLSLDPGILKVILYDLHRIFDEIFAYLKKSRLPILWRQ